MPYALLPAFPVLLMIGRVYRPWAGPVPGALVRRHPLPLLSRLRLHGRPATAAVLSVAVGVASGWLAPWLAALLTLGVVGVILIPVTYLLTTEGIACGRTPPRRWTEFAGVARRSGGARLQAIGGRGGLDVWLAGSHDIDGTVLLVRRLVRGSYQGRDTGGPSQAGPPEGAARPLDVVAAGVG